MKVTDIECILLSSEYGDGNVLGQPLGVKSIALIKAETDNDFVGVSEVYVGIYVPELVCEIVSSIKKFIINKDINKLIENNILKIPFVSRNGIYNSLIGGIELALLDCLCKSKNIPLWKIFTKTPNNNLKYYFSGGSAAFSPDKIENEVKNLDSIFQGYKMRIGFQDWNTDKRRILKANSSINDKSLMIDAIMGSINPSWTFMDFKNKYQFFQEVNPYWIEEPFHPDDIDSYKKACKMDIPIAFGEALVGKLEFYAYLKSVDLSFIQLDATHMGGVNIANEIFKLKSSISSATHTWGSCVSFMINLHMSYAFKQFEWVEVPGVEFLISNDMGLGSYIDILHNKKTILDKPGIGIDIDFNLLKEKYPFKKNSGFSLK